MNARKGTRRERQRVHELKELGYTVIRSAGSRGPFDLVAINGREMLLEQIKASKTKHGIARARREAKAALRGVRVPPRAQVNLVVYVDRMDRIVISLRPLVGP